MAKDVDCGWSWVVMVASFGSHFLSGGFLFSVGLVHLALLETFVEDTVKTAWVGSLSTALSSVSGPLASIVINRFSCRTCMIAGGLLMLVGCSASAFVRNINWMFFTYGFLAGTGEGLAYCASAIVMGYNFQKYRNLACGLAISGLGIGLFSLSPAFQAAFDTYGFPGLLLIMAAIVFHQCLFGSLCRPSSLEKKCKRTYRTSKYDTALPLSKRLRRHFNVLTRKPFVCFCFSFFLAHVGVSMVYLYLPHYAITMGTTSTDASWLLSVIGISILVARIFTGFVASSKHVNEVVLYSGAYGFAALTILLFPLYSGSYAGQILFSVLFGLFSMDCYVILASITIQLVGLEYLSSAFGVEMIWCGAGFLLGPPLAGVVMSNGGSYEHAFIIAGVAVLLGCLFGFITPCIMGNCPGEEACPGEECLSKTCSIETEGQTIYTQTTETEIFIPARTMNSVPTATCQSANMDLEKGTEVLISSTEMKS